MTRRTVALVGRPNVGKSTLFNRIVGGRAAIVDERPGVTRDRHYGKAEWAGETFWVVDTGGLVARNPDPLERAVQEQVDLAVASADLVLLLVDVQTGPHPDEREIADVLRRAGKPVLLVANKADDLPLTTGHHEFHALGLGAPVPVSAATGKGSGDLLDRVVGELPRPGDAQDQSVIQVALVGRPNVGKSSIMNRLLASPRSVVAAEPGTTRDAIDSPLRFGGWTLNFIDTAGLRKRARVADSIEFYSMLRTERAIESAEVCVLVVDATQGMATQDLRIAETAWERGAGLIIAVNKWDLIEEKDANTAVRGERQLRAKAPFLSHVPFLYVSALTGQRVRRLLDMIVAVAEQRTTRIPTAEVNRVLAELVARHHPPQAVGREVKLLYASQIGVAPPTFAIVASRPAAIPDSYTRYLVNGFRAAWSFDGVPIRVKLRSRRRLSA